MADHFSPEMRAWLNAAYTEEARRIGPLLDDALAKVKDACARIYFIERLPGETRDQFEVRRRKEISG